MKRPQLKLKKVRDLKFLVQWVRRAQRTVVTDDEERVRIENALAYIEQLVEWYLSRRAQTWTAGRPL